ncbi:MAG: hypothetical protein CMA77_01490 [Euryarchaeota archaeon]|nr:hypothetical protein [Euryarchaeota archaeon]
MAGELRRLAIALSKLPKHPQRSSELEQYVTEGDFAARWIAAILESGDLNEQSKVVDLGSGNGILGIGLILAGAESVTLVEIDEDATEAAKIGVTKLGIEGRARLITEDVSTWENWPTEIKCDILIMNPPWGFQKSRADRPFLELAFSSPASVIHLLHSADAKHPQGMARDAGWKSEMILEGQIRLPAQYEHHKRAMSESPVKCWRFSR